MVETGVWQCRLFQAIRICRFHSICRAVFTGTVKAQRFRSARLWAYWRWIDSKVTGFAVVEGMEWGSEGSRFPRVCQGKVSCKPLRIIVVGGEGFEPSKSKTADLQSAPFGHSGIHPFTVAALKSASVI